METQTNWSKKNENSLVGGQGPDPLPRIWVCVHKVSIVCGNMWDSPQGFPPIPPLHSSTAGEWVGGETMWSPLRPAPAAPSCRPAEQNFIDYFTGRRTTLQPHWSTARPKQTTTEVPSPSGGSSSTLKVRHQDLHLALEMHLENMKHWNTKILRRHLVALLDEVDLWQMVMMLEVMKWKRESRVIFHLHLQQCHIPPPEDSSWRHGCKRQQGKSAVSEQHTIPCSIFLIIGWICLLSLQFFCHIWPTSQNEKKVVLKLLHTLW